MLLETRHEESAVDDLAEEIGIQFIRLAIARAHDWHSGYEMTLQEDVPGQ